MITVLCHGCFDILHIGHVRHLKEARTFGDRLVVSLSMDEHILVHKGQGRPVYSIGERAEMIAALRMVDDVVVSETSSAVGSIMAVRPQVFCKGSDYTIKSLNRDEALACELVNARIMFTASEKRSVREDMRRCE